MDLKQAYETLGLQKNATTEEVNKAFRKTAAQYHPDKNKDPGAEQKFKDINSAYQVINNPPPEPQMNFQQQGGFGGFQGGFNVQHRHTTHHTPPLTLSVTLTFIEAVLGCVKEFEADKQVCCTRCDGEGGLTSKVCSTCQGKGKKIYKQNNDVFIVNCETCGGNGRQVDPCPNCSGTGTKTERKKFSIPFQGICESGRIRVPGGGHFKSMGFFGSGTEDCLIDVTVQAHPSMRVDELNVISTVEVTLLQALEGTKVVVETVKGQIKLKVPAGVRNKDKIELRGYGVVVDGHGTGNHMFELDVQYPAKSERLIKFLKES